ncbi:MAG: hypothetical protein HY321_06800 [Armatimonadetes bacterium]|nr:hypothetical protein [Armatimonadota bacterium]
MAPVDAARLLLCEPQCCGYEHAEFNAALLYTALLAYPEAQITFLGEEGHRRLVRAELSRLAGTDEHSVAWEDIRVPERLSGEWDRFRQERNWCAPVLRRAVAEGARALIPLSITGPGLLALKVAMRRQAGNVPVLVVMHSELNSILEPKSRRPWIWPVQMRMALRLPHPPRLRYVVLGESIRRSVADVLPGVAGTFRALPHPCVRPVVGRAEVPGVVRFSYLGVASHGFEVFCRLAAEVAALRPGAPCEFSMAGFVNEPHGRCPEGAEAFVSGISRQPLARAEYDRRVASTTYAVGTWKPSAYRLTASGSFMDAIGHLKPGIYLRNPFVEHCFGMMGDIGYLCDTPEQMRDLMLSLLARFPADRYVSQCENIRRGRARFEPPSLAPTLRAIIEDVRSESRR